MGVSESDSKPDIKEFSYLIKRFLQYSSKPLISDVRSIFSLGRLAGDMVTIDNLIKDFVDGGIIETYKIDGAVMFHNSLTTNIFINSLIEEVPLSVVDEIIINYLQGVNRFNGNYNVMPLDHVHSSRMGVYERIMY